LVCITWHLSPSQRRTSSLEYEIACYLSRVIGGVYLPGCCVLSKSKIMRVLLSKFLGYMYLTSRGVGKLLIWFRYYSHIMLSLVFLYNY
jgi:hypothetical protein